MIIKSFELNKLNLNDNNYFLFYGVNEGAKFEETITIKSKNKDRKVYKYEEKEVLDKSEEILNDLMSKSLFEDKKIIIINRSSDKIIKFLSELFEKNITDLILIIDAAILDKKSKLRLLFEKDKKLICVPFYQDTHAILSTLVQKFLRREKINISQSNINLIIQKCNGDRGILNNELEKIGLFCKNKKTITVQELNKLINLIENFGISELVDNCLAKNKSKTINILNENIFNLEDSIIIIRTFLIKLKKIQKIADEYLQNKNLDLAISKAKPPVFWKDKEIVKQQIKNWKPDQIKKLIYEISEIELAAKKNINNSINLTTDFIIQKAS